MADADLADDIGQLRGIGLRAPLQGDLGGGIGQWPGGGQGDGELCQEVKWVEDIGGDLGVGSQAHAHAKGLEGHLAVQPNLAVEVGRLEVDQHITGDPGFQYYFQGAVLPFLVVSPPDAHGQAVGIQHEVGFGDEHRQGFGPDALVTGFLLADVQIPAIGIVQAVEGLGAGADVHHASLLALFVTCVHAQSERAGTPIQYRQGLEGGVLAHLCAFLQQVGTSLEHEDGAGEDDDQQQVIGQGQAVVRRSGHRDAGAEAQGAGSGPPFVEVGDPFVLPVIPALGTTGDGVPFLFAALVGFVLAGEQAGKAVQGQAGGPQGDAGRQIGVQIDGHVLKSVAITIVGAENQFGIHAQAQGHQFQIDITPEFLAFQRYLTLEGEGFRNREFHADAVQRHRRLIAVREDTQALHRGAGGQALGQFDPAVETDPFAASCGIAHTELGNLEAQPGDLGPVLVRQIDPAALDIYIAFGIDAQLVDAHAGGVGQ